MGVFLPSVPTDLDLLQSDSKLSVVAQDASPQEKQRCSYDVDFFFWNLLMHATKSLCKMKQREILQTANYPFLEVCFRNDFCDFS